MATARPQETKRHRGSRTRPRRRTIGGHPVRREMGTDVARDRAARKGGQENRIDAHRGRRPAKMVHVGPPVIGRAATVHRAAPVPLVLASRPAIILAGRVPTGARWSGGTQRCSSL
jgi:hypothetical protein